MVYLDLDIPEDATLGESLSSESRGIGVASLRDKRDRGIASVTGTIIAQELNTGCNRVVTQVQVSGDTSVCVGPTSGKNDRSSASSDHVQTLRSLKSDDTSDVEHFLTDCLRHTEDQRSLVQRSSSNKGRSQSHVSESHGDTGSIDSSLLSVSEEEDHILRHHDRLVHGDKLLVLQENISLLKSMSQVDTSRGSSAKGGGQSDVDNRQVKEGHSRKTGNVAKTHLDLSLTGIDLSVGRSDREDSKDLLQDVTFVSTVEVVDSIVLDSVEVVKSLHETTDAVIVIITLGVVSTTSEVKDILPELDLALEPISKVSERSLTGEVVGTVGILRDGVTKLKISLNITRDNTLIQVNLVVDQRCTREDHSGNVRLEHSVLDHSDRRKEKHSNNRVDVLGDAVLVGLV